MKILTYNFLDGGIKREDMLRNALKQIQADVVVIQEVTRPILIDALARTLKLNYFIAQGNSKRHLAILSRYPIVNKYSFHPIPLKHTLLEAQVLIDGNFCFDIFGIHLAPYPHLFFELWRVLEISAILKRIRELGTKFFALCGDFNSVAPGDIVDIKNSPIWFKSIVWLQGNIFPRFAIKKIQQSGLIDCYREVNTNSGFTLPSDRPQIRLDYCFVPVNLRNNIVRCNIPPNISCIDKASDHLPLLLELDL